MLIPQMREYTWFHAYMWYAGVLSRDFPQPATSALIWTSVSLSINTTNQWYLWGYFNLILQCMQPRTTFISIFKVKTATNPSNTWEYLMRIYAYIWYTCVFAVCFISNSNFGVNLYLCQRQYQQYQALVPTVNFHLNIRGQYMQITYNNYQGVG